MISFGHVVMMMESQLTERGKQEGVLGRTNDLPQNEAHIKHVRTNVRRSVLMSKYPAT